MLSELNEIRSSVRKLALSEIPQYQNEAAYGKVPRPLFTKFAELGLSGITIAPEYDGLGLGPVAAAAVLEEISSVDLGPAIFLSVHLMVSGLIAKFGTAEQKQKYLPDLAAGKLLAAFALTEMTAGSDAAALTTSAKETPQGYVLHGSKAWITSAGFADIYLVFARTGTDKGKDGISAFLVPADAPGLSAGKPEHKMGCELSPIATLTLDQVSVPRENLLGTLNAGYKIALGGLAGGRINIAACANGLSSAAITRATAYLKDRRQFGSALIEFQGLQFMLADMKMQFEAAKLLTKQAAETLENTPASRENRIAPALAKCFATDAAMRITTDAVQLFGGAGYVREFQVERLMRDAKMLQIVEGTNQIQRIVIAREMQEA